MANTYTWKILKFKVRREENDLVNVVYEIEYIYNATDGTYKTGIHGVQTVGAPDPANYTEFEDLTQQQVESWLVASIDMEALNQLLDGKLTRVSQNNSRNMKPPF